MKTRQSWTVDGVLFILVTLAVGFAAYNTGASLLYLVLAMLLAFLVVSGFMASYMLRGLEVERRFVGALFARRPAPVSVVLRNTKRFFASYSLVLRDEIASDAGAGSTFAYALAPGAEESLHYHVTFPRRGWAELSRIVLETRYPFGFFERRLTLPLRRRVLVYPQLFGVRLDQWRVLGRPGAHGGDRKGEGTELHSLRDYTREDSARRIVWKVSARVNRLIVAETERDADPIYHLAIHPVVADPGARETIEAFEAALSFLASLAVAIVPRGQRMVLYTPDGEVTLNERADLDRLLRVLATMELALAPAAAAGADPKASPPAAAPAARRLRAPATALQVVFDGEARVTRHALERHEWSALMRPLDDAEGAGKGLAAMELPPAHQSTVQLAARG